MKKWNKGNKVKWKWRKWNKSKSSVKSVSFQEVSPVRGCSSVTVQIRMPCLRDEKAVQLCWQKLCFYLAFMTRELPWITVVANTDFLCATNYLVGFKETLFDLGHVLLLRVLKKKFKNLKPGNRNSMIISSWQCKCHINFAFPGHYIKSKCVISLQQGSYHSWTPLSVKKLR